jgi:ankyrin repeat protein
MFALIRKHKPAVAELLKRGADPNRRSANGENGVTLAVRLAPSDLDYLKLVLESRGDPNTLEPDSDPVLSTVIGQNNPEAIQMLGAARADLNALDRTRAPLIVKAAYIAHWKCVWTLVELNADWRVDDKGVTVAWLAYSSQLKPDSPVYPWLQKTREFLLSHGVVFPPPSPRLVNSQKRQGR